MRLVVFDGGRLGALDGDDVVELSISRPPDHRGPLHAVIASDSPPGSVANAPRRRLAEVGVEAPLPQPGKILGAPVNYIDHGNEMGEHHTVAQLGVFLKAPSSVLAPGGTIRLPYTDQRTDHEAELAVVIGRTARNLPPERALEHVFGYTCALDITVRSGEDRSTRKSFDTFTPLGTAVTTADEVGDPGRLRIRSWVNGALRQDASTKDMIYGVPELLAYASSVMTLWPGDVILTGTPDGVGPMAVGETVSVTIEGIGTLTNRVMSRD